MPRSVVSTPRIRRLRDKRNGADVRAKRQAAPDAIPEALADRDEWDVDSGIWSVREMLQRRATIAGGLRCRTLPDGVTFGTSR
jgi:hypothetical protein